MHNQKSSTHHSNPKMALSRLMIPWWWMIRTIAAVVNVGIINPRDEILFTNRTDAQAINNSLAFTIQCAVSVSKMSRHLHVRGREVQALSTQILILKQLFKDSKRKNRELKWENRDLKNLVDGYANNLGTRSTELERNTNQLREQYDRLLGDVQRLVSR